MIPFFPSCTGAWIIKKVNIFTVFELYLHYFIVAFVVRFSNVLFCDLLKNDPFILKHSSLIVTVIVYGVPSIEVSVNLGNNSNEWTYYFKRITSCLLAYMFVSEPLTNNVALFFSQCYIKYIL